MTEAGFEVLSALLDREPVDADDLARVLEEPSGRQALVDFVRVRQAIAADPGDAVLSAVASPEGQRAFGARSLVRAVAAVVLFALAAAGGAWTHAELTKERPPVPDRIVRFQPGVDWK